MRILRKSGPFLFYVTQFIKKKILLTKNSIIR